MNHVNDIVEIIQDIQDQMAQNQQQILAQMAQIAANQQQILAQIAQNQQQNQANHDQIQNTLLQSQERFEALSNNATINYGTQELKPPRMINKAQPPNDAPRTLDAINKLTTDGRHALLYRLEGYYNLAHNGNIETRKAKIKQAYGMRLF